MATKVCSNCGGSGTDYGYNGMEPDRCIPCNGCGHFTQDENGEWKPDIKPLRKKLGLLREGAPWTERLGKLVP